MQTPQHLQFHLHWGVGCKHLTRTPTMPRSPQGGSRGEGGRWEDDRRWNLTQADAPSSWDFTYKTQIQSQSLLYLEWTTNRDLLNSTGNSAQCYVAAWMGGTFRGEWIHTPFYVHLKLSQHCKSAIPQYKIKSLKTIWSQQGREKVGRPEKVVLNHIYYHM